MAVAHQFARPGSQPANLQGLWNDSLTPSWDSKYTVNINTEMNYWPAETCNLAECHAPLFDMLDDLAISGGKTAKTSTTAFSGSWIATRDDGRASVLSKCPLGPEVPAAHRVSAIVTVTDLPRSLSTRKGRTRSSIG